VISVQALLLKANANWAATAYISAVILVSAYLIQQQKVMWLKISFWINVSFFIFFMGFETYLASQENINTRWREFGQEIQTILAQQPQANLIVDNRNISSHSVYYSKVPLTKLTLWDPNNKVDWFYGSGQLQAGNSYFYLTSQKEVPKKLTKQFVKIEKIKSYTVSDRLRVGIKNDVITLYYLEGPSS
jgi:hypothetical protein